MAMHGLNFGLLNQLKSEPWVAQLVPPGLTNQIKGSRCQTIRCSHCLSILIGCCSCLHTIAIGKILLDSLHYAHRLNKRDLCICLALSCPCTGRNLTGSAWISIIVRLSPLNISKVTCWNFFSQSAAAATDQCILTDGDAAVRIHCPSGGIPPSTLCVWPALHCKDEYSWSLGG